MSTYNRTQRRRIGEILVDQGLVTKEHFDEALRIQQKTGETLGGILVDMGCITDMDITKTIVTQYQLPYILLDNYKVSDKLVGLFDIEFLHQHKIVPFDQIGEMLLCAVAEVPRDEILSEIPRKTQRNVALYVAALTDVERYLDRLAPLPGGKKKDRNPGASPATAGPSAARPAASVAVAASPATTPTRAPKIFDEATSESILEALDSTWDSIFESVDDSEEKIDDSSDD